MVVLDNGYRIEADAYQYTLFRLVSGKKDPNVMMKVDVSYHPSLKCALRRYYRLLEAKKYSDGYLSLGEAMDAAERILSRLEEVVNRINEDK